MRYRPDSEVRLFWLVAITSFLIGLALVLLVQMFGCGVATQQGQHRSAAHSQIVAQHRIYRTYHDWEASPWSRPGDSYGITPVNILVSEQGYGCIVEPGDWVMAQERVRFVCESGWRAPRPR